MPAETIYLDNNATTRPDPAVVEAMLPYLGEHYGNPSSAHPQGHASEGALVAAREQVAALLGCAPAEIVFNAGGTEGLNHVFRGIHEAFQAKKHFLVSAVEHPAVLALAAWLRGRGCEVEQVPVDGEGRLDLAFLEGAIRANTALVSVMAANNESGVLFPLGEVARIVKGKGVLLHVDATQAAGKVPLDLAALPADLLNLSGHKFHGPKGAGALFIRRSLRLRPFMIGGHQERGRRGGTENVPGLVGLGKAAELARGAVERSDAVQGLRDELERTLFREIEGVMVAGAGAPRLPNTSLFCFEGIEGEALLLRLAERGVCVSTGSACSTGLREPSHVLRAMGIPAAFAQGTIRVSLSRFTTAAESAAAASMIPALVSELRALSPFGR